ncbi:hypothetical protein Hdeb2414_s0008g00271601 [Helianthus debilis subsp. tardiflorus]
MGPKMQEQLSGKNIALFRIRTINDENSHDLKGTKSRNYNQTYI